MGKSYKPITSMKEVPEQLRKLRRQYLRYQQAEIIYSISHKKLFELASDAGAIYRIDGTVLINRDIFDAYLERFHEPATGKGKEEIEDERSEKILHDDRNRLDYVLVGDYYIPMLALPEENRPIGYWKIFRREYLKKHKSGMYSYLLLTGKLDSYLADLNEQA